MIVVVTSIVRGSAALLCGAVGLISEDRCRYFTMLCADITKIRDLDVAEQVFKIQVFAARLELELQ